MAIVLLDEEAQELEEEPKRKGIFLDAEEDQKEISPPPAKKGIYLDPEEEQPISAEEKPGWLREAYYNAVENIFDFPKVKKGEEGVSNRQSALLSLFAKLPPNVPDFYREDMVEELSRLSDNKDLFSEEGVKAMAPYVGEEAAKDILMGSPEAMNVRDISLWQAIKEGYGESILGMYSDQRLKNYEEYLARAESELPLIKRTAKSFTKIIGDLPAFAAGGTAASLPAGGPTNPIGAVLYGMGAFGTQQMIESAYIEALRLIHEHPELEGKTLDQIAALVSDPKALKNIGLSTLEGSGLGALLAANPLLWALKKTPLGKLLDVPIVGKGIKGATDVATLTVTPAAIRGELPTTQSIIDNSLLIFGLKVGEKAATKIADWAVRKNLTIDKIRDELGENFTQEFQEELAAAKTQDAADKILDRLRSKEISSEEKPVIPSEGIEEKAPVEKGKQEAKPAEAEQPEAIEKLKSEERPSEKEPEKVKPIDTPEYWEKKIEKTEKNIEKEQSKIKELKKEIAKEKRREKKGEKVNLDEKYLELNKALDGLKEEKKNLERNKSILGAVKKGIKPSKTRKGYVQPEQKQKVPEMGTEKEVSRKSEIVNLFRDAFQDTPIRIGKIKQPPKDIGVIKGLFKPKEGVIRIKEANDIETAAHEFGHKLHFALYGEGDTAKAQINAVNEALEPYAPEIVPISKYAPHLLEGFAEFTRMYVTNPEGAKEVAPAFYREFEAQLKEKAPKVGEALLKAREMYKSYLKADPVARVVSHIHSSFDRGAIGKTKDWFTRKFNLDRIQYQWLDETYPIKRAVADTVGIAPRDVENWKSPLNAYHQARLLKGWAGVANQMLFNKTIDFKTLKPNGKGLKEILKPIKTQAEREELSAYLVAKRAQELAGRDIKSGIDIRTVNEVVKRLEGKYHPIAQEIYGYQDRVLNYARDSGLYSQKQIDKMRELNQYYVPFYRVFEEGEKNISQGMSGGRAALQAQKTLKRIFGSTREIQDPIESIIRNTMTLVENAQKNEVAQTLSKLTQVSPRGGKYMEKVPPRLNKIFELEREELLKEVAKEVRRKDPFHEITNSDEEAMDIAAELLPESISRWNSIGYGPRENIITVYFDGKPKYYETTPEIAKLFRQGGLSNVYTNPLVKMLAIPAKIRRAGAILNPRFVQKNPVRDYFEGFLFTKNPKGMMDLLYYPFEGLSHAIKQDEVFADWMRAGGGMSTMQSIDKSMKSLTNVWGSDLVKKLNPMFWLRKVSEIGEEMNRLAEYAKAIENTGDSRWQKQMAAFQARDLSVDFAKYGYYAKALNQIIPFWNARVQGGEKFFRTAFSTDPEVRANFYTRWTSGVLIPSLALQMMNDGDKEIEELDEVTKDSNFIFRDPMSGDIWKIPVPFEPGIIGHGLMRRYYNYAVNKDPHAFDGFLGSIIDGALPGFIPAGADTFIEIYANKDFFRNRHIIEPHKLGLISEEQYSTYTTQTAREIARALSYLPGIDPLESHLTNPSIVEHFITSWGAGLGYLALNLSDKALELAGKTRDIPKPEREFLDQYGLNAFKVRYPTAKTKSIQQFYEIWDRWNRLDRSIEAKKDKRDLEGMKRLRTEREKLAPPNIERMHTAIRNNQKLINNVYQDPNMKEKKKREMLDKLYLRQIQMARSFMHEIDKYQRKKKLIK